MKNKFLLKALILILAVLTASAGTWSPNKFFYQPALNARGATEKSNFDTGLNRADAHLSHFKTLGDPDYSTLAEAITTIGSANRTLIIPAGQATIAVSTPVPPNITLRFLSGGIFHVNTDVILEIQGPIEAGPYQIFSWSGTGTINLLNSPVEEVPFEWFGAVEGIVADNSSALVMALKATSSSIGSLRHRWIKVSKGVWRLATPISVTTTSDDIYIKGSGFDQSGFYIDVGSTNDALTLGSDGYSQKVNISDIAFVGPANACKRGLVISSIGDARLDNVDFWLGCTDYACWLENIVWLKGSIFTRHTAGLYYYLISLGITPGECAKGLKLTNSPLSGGINSSELWIELDAPSDPPLMMEGSAPTNWGPNSVMKISGTIENWATGASPFIIDKAALLEIDNLYCEGGESSAGAIIRNSVNVKLSTFLMNAITPLILSNSRGVIIDNYNLSGLIILPDCVGTVIGTGQNINIDGYNNNNAGIQDYAGDTVYLNGPFVGVGVNANSYPQPNLDSTNFIYNSQFTRWQTDRPDGWTKSAAQTWTQETGTVHTNPNCAKSVVTGATGSYVDYGIQLDAYQLSRIKGKTFTLSFWYNFPVGQSWGNTPLIVSPSIHCPTRLSSTAYQLGDAVTIGGFFNWLCVQAGTTADSGNIPTFSDNYDAHTVTDGTVIWRGDVIGASSNPGQLAPQTSDGIWRQMSVAAFIPRNATSVNIDFYQYIRTGDAETTMYLADPALMLGRQTQRTAIANNPNEVLIGGINKVDSGSAPPTSGFSLQSDIRWNSAGATGGISGWKCITSGINGSGSAWEKMAVTAPLP